MNPTCRSCGAPLEHTFADLGLSPLANSYVAAECADVGEMFHPLHAFVCDRCFLVQIGEFASPEAIFSTYAYASGFSAGWLAHVELYAAAMMVRFGLGPEHRVVEVASNDGTLLKAFQRRGVPVLGVEPAANLAEGARAAGVPTETRFFGRDTAAALAAEGHAADLIAANNVLAHVPDLHDFVAGFRTLLKPLGVATFEFPHLLRMIESCQFDTIYHEHFSYLSLGVVIGVMARAGLRVFDVEELATHGGSLRVYVCRIEAGYEGTAAVARVLGAEARAGLGRLDGHAGFAGRIGAIRDTALEFLIRARRAGKRVYGYGAAAKGNTFLNYCGIGPDYITAVADRSPLKQGTLLPGSRIPVITPQALLAARPDHVLILPWNLREEVAEQLAEIRAWGGTFVTAIPTLEVF